jgi:hypothetical protein
MNNIKQRKRKLNHSKSIVICIFILFIFTSCKKFENNDLETSFISAVESTRCGDSVILQELTKFTWDKFYLIESEYDDEDISRIIGFSFPCGTVPDWHERYLFVDTYNQEVEYFDLSYDHGFDFNCLEFEYLTPETLVLKPSKMRPESKVRYYLNPIHCPEENFISVKCGQ